MKKLATAIAIATMLTPAATTHAAPDQSGSCPQYEKLFKKYGLPAKQFSKIAWRESRCSFKIISPVRKSTGWPDAGLLQIQGSWNTLTRQICHLKPSQSQVIALTKPDCHLRVAKYLYENGGMGHWKGSSSHG